MDKKPEQMVSTVSKPEEANLSDLRAELDFRTRQQEFLNRFSRAALAEAEVVELFQLVESEIRQLIGPVFTRFLELYPGSGWLVRAVWGWPETREKTLLAFGYGEMASYAYSQDTVVMVENFADEKRFVSGKDYEGLGSGIAVVIPGKDRHWGVLEVAEPVGKKFAPYEQDFLNTLAALLGGAIERKTLETEARESDERMRLVMSASRDGIWDWNIQTDDVYWNERFYEILGLKQTQAYMRFEDVTALIHPDDLKVMSERLEIHFRDDSPYELELRMRDTAGVYKILYTRGKLIRNEQGEPVRMVGLVTDMSELEELGLRMQESEIRFQTLADGIPVFIGVQDANGRALYYNKACQDFVGETSQELVENSWMRHVHPDDVDALYRSYREAIPLKKPFTFEYRVIGKEGQVRCLMNYAIPRFQPNGTFMGYVALGLDVTEERLYMTRFRRVFDSNMMGILFWREDGLVTEANDAVLEMIGHTPADISVGQVNWKAFPTVEPPDMERIWGDLGLKGVGGPYEQQFVKPDGSVLDVLTGIALLEEGDLSQGVAFYVDMTEQKKATNRYKRIMDSNIIGVSFTTEYGDILDCNNAFLDMLGFSREDLAQGLNLWDLTPKEYMDVSRDAVNQFRTLGGSQPFEKQYFRQDGGRVDSLVVITALSEKDRRNAIIITLDMTRQKMATARYRRIMESNMIGVLFTRKGEINQCNEAFLDMLGYTREEFNQGQARDLWRLTPPDSMDVSKEAIERYYQTGTSKTFEKQYIHKDGHYVDALVSIASLVEGTSDESIVLVSDISTQKRTTAKLQRIMDANLVGIIFARLNGDILESNDVFLQTLGYSREDLKRGELNFWDLTPPDFKPICAEAVEILKRDGICQPFEKQYRHKDGHPVDVLVALAAMGPESTSDALAIVFDITSRKQAERDLKRTLEREQLTREILEIASLSEDIENVVNQAVQVIGKHFQADQVFTVYYSSVVKPLNIKMAISQPYRSSEAIPLFSFQDYPPELEHYIQDYYLPYLEVEKPVIKSPEEFFEAFRLSFENSPLPNVEREELTRMLRYDWLERLHIRSYARLNIEYLGKIYGSLSLIHCGVENYWTPREMQVLGDVVNYLGVAFYQLELNLHEKMANEQLQLALKREKLNRAVLEITNQSLEPQPMIEAVTERIGRHFGADRCLIIYYVSPPDAKDMFNMYTAHQYRSSEQVPVFNLQEYSPALVGTLNRLLPDSARHYADRALDVETFFDSVLAYFRSQGMSESEVSQYHQELKETWYNRFKIRSFARMNIVYRGKIYGSIALHHCSEERKWNEIDMELLGDNAAHIGASLYQMELHQHEQFVMWELEKSYRLINIISEAQAQFITSSDNQGMFRDLLNRLLAYTDSEYGFIGEVFLDADGTPYLKTRFLTDIAWNPETRSLYEEHEASGMEFHNLHTLFGAVITTGETMISNEPSADPRGNGLPEGHPPLNTFLGMPLYKGQEMVGLIGLANRPDGYTEALAKELHPYLVACANIIVGVHNEAIRERLTQELRLSEQALKNYASRLERSNKELEQFATIASHDLQAPLRKVILFSDYLKTSLGENISDESQDYMTRIQKATRKMQSLITDLLALSRVSRKGKPFVPVDLREIAEDVLGDLDEYIRETQAEVKLGTFITIDADGMQLHQIFQNLIGNALKFHLPDVHPVIEVSATAIADNLCEIRVKDNGIGFDEKYLDRIFTVFERLHGDTEYEGTGMGLAIVYKIVERHGGNVTAQSRPGEGATFIVTLPIHQQ